MATEAERLECLDDYGEGTCAGPVEYRMALSATGQSFPRCERHWDERLDEQERITRTYGGVAPPSDFDPAYAGERWEEDY
ncbi:MAG: hypothetical protein LC798_12890 [Chloroflexi bacterium]|nr:hypothetical protein [Chloroflexota bacterium]